MAGQTMGPVMLAGTWRLVVQRCLLAAAVCSCVFCGSNFADPRILNGSIQENPHIYIMDMPLPPSLDECRAYLDGIDETARVFWQTETKDESKENMRGSISTMIQWVPTYIGRFISPNDANEMAQEIIEQEMCTVIHWFVVNHRFAAQHCLLHYDFVVDFFRLFSEHELAGFRSKGIFDAVFCYGAARKYILEDSVSPHWTSDIASRGVDERYALGTEMQPGNDPAVQSSYVEGPDPIMDLYPEIDQNHIGHMFVPFLSISASRMLSTKPSRLFPLFCSDVLGDDSEGTLRLFLHQSEWFIRGGDNYWNILYHNHGRKPKRSRVRQCGNKNATETLQKKTTKRSRHSTDPLPGPKTELAKNRASLSRATKRMNTQAEPVSAML